MTIALRIEIAKRERSTNIDEVSWAYFISSEERAA